MSEHLEVDHASVVYPESDGAPLGETEVHVEELASMRDVLKHRFRADEDVYIGANMFVYYEQGNPRAVFAPDVFVVRGVDKTVRRTYKLWLEKQPPCFVLELSSNSTWLEDTGNKKALCARLGVREYFLFDPLGDYLEPRLQGFRLDKRDYLPIEPDAGGAVVSKTLGLVLSAEGTQLRCADANTSERLLRSEEARQAWQDAEQARREAEQALRAAEERARNAEAEIERLQRRLSKGED